LKVCLKLFWGWYIHSSLQIFFNCISHILIYCLLIIFQLKIFPISTVFSSLTYELFTYCFIFRLLFLVILRLGLRVLCLPGKHFIPWAVPKFLFL
jgi:hypothetical protein